MASTLAKPPKEGEHIERTTKMHQEHVVRSIEFAVDECLYEASYYIEHGMVHAIVNERPIRFPAGPDPSEEAIRSLLQIEVERHLAAPSHIGNPSSEG